jgi:hypothetical protein
MLDRMTDLDILKFITNKPISEKFSIMNLL